MYFVNISCYKKYKLGAEGFEETEWVSSGFAISVTKKLNQCGVKDARSCELMTAAAFWYFAVLAEGFPSFRLRKLYAI